MDSISTSGSLLGTGQSHKANIQNQGAGKKDISTGNKHDES
jgi:hypothetical protein